MFFEAFPLKNVTNVTLEAEMILLKSTEVPSSWTAKGISSDRISASRRRRPERMDEEQKGIGTAGAPGVV